MPRARFVLTIQRRVTLLAFLSVIGVVGAFFLASVSLSSALFQARIVQTEREVDSAVSLLRKIQEQDLMKGTDGDSLKTEALAHLRGMTDGQQEYFFVFDEKGVALLHPLPELQGHNNIELQDAVGKKIVQEFIRIVKTKGSGSITYFWPPHGETREKISYIKEFAPWGWIVGRGVHIDDIRASILAIQLRLAFAALVFAFFVFGVAYWIGRDMSRPLVALNGVIRKLADGEHNLSIPALNRRDEIGSIAQTAQIFLENARRIALLENEQKDTDNLKGEFVSVVSHELRTPLTSIRGSLGLVANGAAGPLPDKAQKLVSIAHNNCERLILLINDILDIDKIAAGSMQYDLRPTFVQEAVLQTVEATRAFAERYFVRYDVKPMDPSWSVCVDPARFQQVLTNFLSNAAKFSLSGAQVEVVAERKGALIRLSVNDHGMGIGEEFQPRLFKKFSQADGSTTRKKGGTGLGLYICKQLTEQMGGQIGYETKTGLGSTFWVEFPLACPQEACANPEGSREKSGAGDDKEAGRAGPLPVIIHVEPDDGFSEYLAAAFHRQATLVQFKTMQAATDYLACLPPLPAGLVVIADLNVQDVELGLALAAQATVRGAAFVVLSTREPRADLKERAALVLTKSRVNEKRLVSLVLSVVPALSLRKGEAHE